jgi:hypothetical protein
MAQATTPSTTTPPLDLGAEVEVLCSYNKRWVGGFTVEEAAAGHDRPYRLRRRSDRMVLPGWFADHEVRVTPR